MKELSLNVLDIVQNSISAGAENITVALHEDDRGWLKLTIEDNGCGMSEETVRSVIDPFYTTRKTRKVGMGIPLLKMAAEQTGGRFNIESTPESKDPENHGTVVTAEFDMKHMDFTPIGDMISTVCTIIQGHPDIDYLFEHTTPTHDVRLETAQLREVLGDVSLAEYEIICWIKEHLNEQYSELKK